MRMIFSQIMKGDPRLAFIFTFHVTLISTCQQSTKITVCTKTNHEAACSVHRKLLLPINKPAISK